MRIFRFEKWFTDVLTSERDYMIFFHTLLEVFGFRICFMEVNISRFRDGDNYHLNRKLKVIKRSDHTISTQQGYILYEEGIGKMMLLLHGMEVELNIIPVHPSDFNGRGMKIRNRGGGFLEWKPLYLKSMISGKIRIAREGEQGMNEEKFSGTGYADYLFSTMSPFRVPVRQLYWGRMHSPDMDLTFSYALGNEKNALRTPGEATESSDEVIGAQMMVQTGGETIRLHKISVYADRWEEFIPPNISCPVSYKVEASSERIKLVLKVVHLKQAIVSEFLKSPKELGRLPMALLRRFTREPNGIKFFSLASLEFELDGQNRKLDEVLMIDEYVRFK